MTVKHFEIVRTNSGWHGRWKADNGQIVATSEVYESGRSAIHWVDLEGGGDVGYKIIDERTGDWS